MKMSLNSRGDGLKIPFARLSLLGRNGIDTVERESGGRELCIRLNEYFFSHVGS